MAGIGFELKRLFRGKGFLNSIKAYAFSSMVTVGPMILCVGTVSFIQLLSEWMGISYKERTLFFSAIQYAFVFSLVVTSGFSMLVTRYIADRIYEKDYDAILPALYGMLALTLGIGGVAALLFLWRSPLPFDFKLVSYLLFSVMIVIWVQSVFLSALKDFARIAQSFLIGGVLAAAASYLFLMIAPSAISVVCAMTLGFGTTMLLLAAHIDSFFPLRKGRGYFQFLTYVAKFPSLFGIGFLMMLAIFLHNFLFWWSSLGMTVAGTFRFAPMYDTPVFYAYLSIVPTLVTFVVSVETAFYEKYQDYYSTILHGGTLIEIERAKKKMTDVLLREISFVMQLQLLFSLLFMAVGIKLLPRLGMTSTEVDTFNILILGDCLYIIAFVIFLLLLYFDDRKGVLRLLMLLVACNLIFTPYTITEGHYGLAFFLSAGLTLLGAIWRLLYVIRNIDYYTFCSQPLIERKRSTALTRLVGRFENQAEG